MPAQEDVLLRETRCVLSIDPPWVEGPEGGTALKTTSATQWIHTVIIVNFGSPVVFISSAGCRTSTQSGRLSGSQEDRGVSGVKIQLVTAV